MFALSSQKQAELGIEVPRPCLRKIRSCSYSEEQPPLETPDMADNVFEGPKFTVSSPIDVPARSNETQGSTHQLHGRLARS